MLTGDAEAAEACMARHLGHVRSLWAQGREEPLVPRPQQPQAARRG